MSDFQMILSKAERRRLKDPGSTLVTIKPSSWSMFRPKTHYAVRSGYLVRLPPVLLPITFADERGVTLEYEIKIRIAEGKEEQFVRAVLVPEHPTVEAAELNLRRKVVARLSEISSDQHGSFSAGIAPAGPDSASGRGRMAGSRLSGSSEPIVVGLDFSTLFSAGISPEGLDTAFGRERTAGSRLSRLSESMAAGLDFSALKTALGADVLEVEFPNRSLRGGALVEVNAFKLDLATTGRGLRYPIELSFSADIDPTLRLLTATRKFDPETARTIAEERAARLFVNSVAPVDLRPENRGKLEDRIRDDLNDAFRSYGRIVRALRLEAGEVPPEEVDIIFTHSAPYQWQEREDPTRPLDLVIACHLRLEEPSRYPGHGEGWLREWFSRALRNVLDVELRQVEKVELADGRFLTLADGLTREELLLLKTDDVVSLIRPGVERRARDIGYKATTFLTTPKHEVIALSTNVQVISTDPRAYDLKKPFSGAEVRGNLSATVSMRVPIEIAVRYLDRVQSFRADLREAIRERLENKLITTSPEMFYRGFHRALPPEGEPLVAVLRREVEAAVTESLGAVPNELSITLQEDNAALNEFVGRFRGRQLGNSVLVRTSYYDEYPDEFLLDFVFEINDPSDHENNWPQLMKAMATRANPINDQAYILELVDAVSRELINELHSLDFDLLVGQGGERSRKANGALELAIKTAAEKVTLNHLGMTVTNISFTRHPTKSEELANEKSVKGRMVASRDLDIEAQLHINERETALTVRKKQSEAVIAAESDRADESPPTLPDFQRGSVTPLWRPRPKQIQQETSRDDDASGAT
jgi:hypothetical protein